MGTLTHLIGKKNDKGGNFTRRREYLKPGVAWGARGGGVGGQTIKKGVGEVVWVKEGGNENRRVVLTLRATQFGEKKKIITKKKRREEGNT